VCADSGYGSLENYDFLNKHNIENYVKYFAFNENVSGRNPDSYYLEDDGTLICLNDNKGIKVDIDNRHPTKANGVFYKIDGCRECLFSSYCKRFMDKKDEDFKIFEVVEKLVFYKQNLSIICCLQKALK